MPESYQPLDIDPTVDQYLDKSVEDTLGNAVPSATFGDEVIVETPRDTLLPGETPAQAHIRLQKENIGKKRD